MITTIQRHIVQTTVLTLQAESTALAARVGHLLSVQHPGTVFFYVQGRQAEQEQIQLIVQGVLAYGLAFDPATGPSNAIEAVPEHTALLGGCLLRAVAEVLGAAASTDTLIEAWAHTYECFIAGALDLDDDGAAVSTASTWQCGASTAH